MGDLLDQYGVAAHARLRPDRVAFVFGDRRMTYREVDAAITAASAALHAHGVGPDARLGLALRNRPEWMIAALGGGAPRGPGRADPARCDGRRARLLLRGR